MDALNPENFELFAKLLMEAAKSKNGFMLLALALILAVFLTRKFLASRVPFLGTKAGGALLVFVQAFAGAVATALTAGEPMSWPLALMALKVALTGAGGWTLLKDVFSLLKSKTADDAKAAATEAGAKAAGDVKHESLTDLVNK